MTLECQNIPNPRMESFDHLMYHHILSVPMNSIEIE